jgi:hypothetical protein
VLAGLEVADAVDPLTGYVAVKAPEFRLIVGDLFAGGGPTRTYTVGPIRKVVLPALQVNIRSNQVNVTGG